MELTGLFLPGRLARHSGGIWNVASAASFQPGPYMAVYYATKAFVLSFTEAVVEEVSSSGVLVSALCPGSTRTNFSQATEVGDALLFNTSAMSVASVAEIGHRAFPVGKVVKVAGLSNRLLAFSVRLAPRLLVRKVVRSLNRRRGR